MKVLVTGATGFIGSSLLKRLQQEAVYECVASVRKPAQMRAGIKTSVVGDLNASTSWHAALQGIDVVVHTAARVHFVNDVISDPLAEYRRINVAGTLNLARQASAAGVKRFVFISSIKVNGENTMLGKPFTAEDVPNPVDAFGISKFEAEQGLFQIANETGMEVVIIRPALVYGPGVKANFATLLRLASKNWPFPLGAIHNKRSLVALDNLTDLIVVCLDHANASQQVFLASDDQDASTTELLTMMINKSGKKPWLIPLPMGVIKFIFTLLGKKSMADKLCCTLQVDISHTKETLDWKPPFSLEQGIDFCIHHSAGGGNVH